MQQFFESRFGSTPQIDLDRQLCRVRLERPLPLDLRAIATEGILKNNMGLGGLQVRVRAVLADGKATFEGTAQQISVQGGPARTTQPWLWLDAKEFGLGTADAVAFVCESSAPVRTDGIGNTH
ncbi:MAG: hypothetical protein JNK15_23250 [Planctomycetes bacterium]|nr:hypothetical protein [Planctomycetota bacterium]